MFAVMGITGNVGGAVASTLLQSGKQVRGILRDPSRGRDWEKEGVELFTSNFDERLAAAFSDVEGVFVMLPPNMAPEAGFPDSVARIVAVKKALLAARPPLAVFLSSWGSEKSSGVGLITPTHMLEQELEGTGIPSAFLRPGWFMENLLYSFPAARTTGKYFSFYQPLERRYAMVATGDVGRVGAETLLQSWQGSRVIEISGPTHYSSHEAAAALGSAIGTSVSAVAVPRESWVEIMAQNGVPADRSDAYLEMVDGLNSGWIHFGVEGTEHIKGTIDLVSNVKALAGR